MDRTKVSRNELARFIGCSGQTISKYARQPGFPQPDGADKLDAVECIAWWLTQKAPRAKQRELYGKLSGVLGIETNGEAEAEKPASIAEEHERLDLQLKAHKVSKAIGDCVAFADIRSIVGKLASGIREACGQVNDISGRDVLPLFEAAFSRFEAELDEAQEHAGEPGL